MYSETSGESNYGYITLFFLWGFRPHRVLSTSIRLLSKLGHFLGVAISKKLDYHQKPIFVRLVGTKRKGEEG